MGIFTTTPRTVAVGNKDTAAGYNTYERDFANGFGALTSYTPAWTSTGTAPAIGNGTIYGAHMQIQKMVYVEGKITLGSTSTVGTGTYRVSVPVTAETSQTNIPRNGLWFRDLSAATGWQGFGLFVSGTEFECRFDAASNIVWSATAPAVPANTDFLSWAFWYWAA